MEIIRVSARICDPSFYIIVRVISRERHVRYISMYTNHQLRFHSQTEVKSIIVTLPAVLRISLRLRLKFERHMLMGQLIEIAKLVRVCRIPSADPVCGSVPEVLLPEGALDVNRHAVH